MAVDAQLAVDLGDPPISSFFSATLLVTWGWTNQSSLLGEPFYLNCLASNVLDNQIRILYLLLLRWDHVSKSSVAPNIFCCCCSSHLHECRQVLFF
jgi:hypothetical protein